MSRSRRHSPVCGFAVCRSEKLYKVYEHRRLRVALHKALSHDDWYRAEYDVRENPWNWGKDGAQHGWDRNRRSIYQSPYWDGKPEFWSTWKAWIK
jgi:hypothetical protein